MNVYVDSSVILRELLGQPGSLAEWKTLGDAVASVLVEVECLRTLDRMRIRKGIDDRQVSAWREAVFRLLEEADTVEVTGPILSRASHPMPAAMGTLDAIHIATALHWREGNASDLTFATHDVELASAARAFGFSVIGV
jgi:predicted nucleic acid-binding protein